MQLNNRKPMELKASELLKNFSRSYHESQKQPEDPPLKMKARKLAFTSRMLHTARKVQKETEVQNQELKIAPLTVRVAPFAKLPEMSQIHVDTSKKSSRQVQIRKKKEQSIFDFKSNLKKRILSPKVLRIEVKSTRDKIRSYSAHITRNRSQNYNNHERNPEIYRDMSPFQFTFGLNQQF